MAAYDGSVGGRLGSVTGMPGDGMFGGNGTSRTGGPGSCHGTGSGVGDGGVGSGGIGTPSEIVKVMGRSGCGVMS